MEHIASTSMALNNIENGGIWMDADFINCIVYPRALGKNTESNVYYSSSAIQPQSQWESLHKGIATWLLLCILIK